MPRERKSLHLHKLNGTRPEYVVPSADLKPGRPRWPKDLPKEEKKVFKDTTRLMERKRSLTEADGEIIRVLAFATVRHKKAVAKLAVEGEIRVYHRLDKHGESVPSEKENLWLKVATDAEKLILNCLDRLGLTPMNRAKVKPTEVPKEEQAEPGAELLTREPVAPAEDEIRLEDIHEESIQ